MSRSRLCTAFAGVGILAVSLVTSVRAADPPFVAKQTTATPCGPCFVDCNQNGRDDACDVACIYGNFCASGGCANGYCQTCGNSADCNGDGVPDECQLYNNDCNGNNVPDDCEASAKEACCLGLLTCSQEYSFCCNLYGGASAGAGSACSSGVCAEEGLACCKPAHLDGTESTGNPWCENHDIFTCEIAQGGSILSVSAGCGALVLAGDADFDGVIDDSCDNCSPTDSRIDCAHFPCSNTDQLDTLICSGASCLYDGIGDACDNCPDDLNSDQADDDGDWVGNVCDNCVGIANTDQLDCENGGLGNGIGDVCDIAADPSLDCDGNGFLDSCDIGNNPSLDCNTNGMLDQCEAAADPSLDCDGSSILDSCEIADDPTLDCSGNGVLNTCSMGDNDDLDGDGIDNIFDKCDYTPLTITVDTGGLFIGTVRADLDGDCDVDIDDWNKFNLSYQDGTSGSTCSPGTNEETLPNCPVCPVCPGCATCCAAIPPVQ